MTRTDFYALVFVIAAGLVSAWLSQDPPRRIEPAPLQPAEPRVPKPTEVSYGEAYVDARVLRPKKIGTVETWSGDDGRTYSLRYMGVGIRPATWPEGGPPTDEEFDAWLALPAGHEFEKDLDGYLVWIRQ